MEDESKYLEIIPNRFLEVLKKPRIKRGVGAWEYSLRSLGEFYKRCKAEPAFSERDYE